MAMLLGWVLFFAQCPSFFAQAPLKHVGENCYGECWKTPGFCDYCGGGNACCKGPKQGEQGDQDSDPAECRGPLIYEAAGQFHECVKASFLPGQQPPAMIAATPMAKAKSTVQQAQCISYMSEIGCDWTNEKSCPGQPRGWKGLAPEDDSVKYKCCCTNGLWKEDATQGESVPPLGGNNLLSKGQCQDYMNNIGCSWTMKNRCPGQPLGSAKRADSDGSLGYQCCCLNDMWQVVPPSTTMNLNAGFDVNHPIDPNAPVNQPAVNTPDGFHFQVTQGGPGQTAPTASGKDPNFLYNHEGPNVHVSRVQQVDPSFTPDKHHGPIHNSFSENSEATRKERCFGGICADLDTTGSAATQHGVAVNGAATQGGNTVLPSYEISAVSGEGDKPITLTIAPISGAVVSQSAGTPTAQVAGAAGAPVAPAGPPAISAKMSGAPAISAKMTAVETTLAAPALAGATTIQVAASAGFAVGDTIAIGGVEQHKITSHSYVAPKFGLDSPMKAKFAAGIAVQKIPAAAAAPADTGSSASSGTSSGGKAPIVTLIIVAIICVCLCVAAAAGYLLSGKKKKRNTTDREAYLKNDFIERQPVYHEVPAQPEEVEMQQQQQQMPAPPPMNGDGFADVIVEGVDMAPLQPTASFPLQQQASVMVAAPAVAAPSGVSFPGMPTLGGGSTYVSHSVYAGAAPATTYTTQAAPTYTTQYAGALPQASSMLASSSAMPFGNYSSPSTIVTGPTTYSQPAVSSYTQPAATSTYMQPSATSAYMQPAATTYTGATQAQYGSVGAQLGMTSNVGVLPQTSSMFRPQMEGR